MAGKYIRGALVEFMDTFLIPLPNIIIFQFNPETMSHTWTQPEAAPAPAGGGQANPLAVSGLPGESFSFALKMDAYDTISDGNPVSEGIARLSGVYSRLAALEMLLYPVETGGGGLLGSVSVSVGGAGIGGSAGGGAAPDPTVPAKQVPTVLFVWGPGRILPVRVTDYGIDETTFLPSLQPLSAKINLTLEVLTPDVFRCESGPAVALAVAAYRYFRLQQNTLALEYNTRNAVQALSLLPF